MGVRFPSVGSTVLSNALPASAAETVVCTVGPMLLPVDSAAVFLQFMFAANAGTNTTGFVARIRRGTSTGGTSIGANTWSQAVTAGSQGVVSGCYVDTPGVVGQLFYVLTIIQTGATAAGSGPDVALLAFAL